MKHLRHFILSIFLLVQISTFAEENQYKNVISFEYQNDTGFSDRYYTDAVKLNYTDNGGDWYVSWLQFQVLDMFFDLEAKELFQSVSIGQDMYTGYNIKNPNPSSDDRPYAGFLYANFAAHIMGENSLNTFAITLGLTGEYSLAEDAQKFVHSLIDSPEPMGWDKQVKNGFGFLFTYQHSRRVYTYKVTDNFSMDLTAMGQANLGNVLVDASAKAMFRFGFNLPNTYDYASIDYAEAKDVGLAMTDGTDWHAYIFAAGKASAVAYDITLDGATYGDYDIEKEYIVGSAYFGVSLRYEAFQMDYAFMITSDTFKSQKGGTDYMSVLSFKYLF